MNKTRALFFSILFLYAAYALSQTVVKGYVFNKKTLEPLPAANIQIVGTLKGTISNYDGQFVLQIDQLPAILLVTYIGYESKTIKIADAAQKYLNLSLKPVILETEAIIVTAEDPAMGIMREVIRRKKEWRKKLKTYMADAYTRVVLENDSGIVSISESISQAYWHHEKGTRELIKTKRQTSNIKSRQNFASANQVPNLYDDDIMISGFRMIGPTHEDAFDYYRFKLTGQRFLDNKKVFDIEVIPTSLLQPTFKGKLAVLDDVFAMIEVDVIPSETILFPPPIREWNLFYKQQFSDFGRDYWLPVDVQIRGDIKISMTGLEFPTIKYNQFSHLNDYQINIELPDSIYENKRQITVDSTTVNSVAAFEDNPQIIPLTVRETAAYDTLDSTMTLQKAFKPTGFLADLVEMTDDNENDGEKESGILPGFLKDFGLDLWFNRVDAFHFGINYNKRIKKIFGFELSGAYNSGLKQWDYGAGVQLYFAKDRGWIGFQINEGTKPRFESVDYSQMIASVLPLAAADDYFDYYRNKKLRFYSGYRISGLRSSLELGFNIENHSSVEKTSDYNLLGKTNFQRANPAIPFGKLNSIDMRITYGNSRIPFGIIGQNRVEFYLEHSSNKHLYSDFSFTRSQLIIDWRIPTFLQRRILPNALDVRLSAGYSTGDLPIQRYGAIDGNLYAFTPFGVLKTLNGRAYEGEKYLALFAEHNFRTTPFELLDLQYLARKGISIIIHGALGRTWIDPDKHGALTYDPVYSENFHQELGFSINGIFDFLRIDAAWRIDRPGFYMGASLARFF